MSDNEASSALFEAVLTNLAAVADIDPSSAANPTPCEGFDVAALQSHVLGWLQFFAAALTDPTGEAGRLDPDAWKLADGQLGADVVTTALADIQHAIRDLPEGELVVMAQARMTKGAVLAMALGEYLTHGWDLSVSTGQAWSPAEGAAEPALEFLQATVAPEYRGPDTGFFDTEVPAPDGTTPFEQLLCFTGRDPSWSTS